MAWKVTTADLPKALATGEGGVVSYQDFVKYKQHLAMYLARFNLQIEDFEEGGKFASETPHAEVSASDHNKYVLAFFTVISTGFKDHDIVFAQLSTVLTSRARGRSKACRTWKIVLDTLENTEAKAAEILQTTEEWNDHVGRSAVVPDDISGYTDWAGRTTKLYQTLLSLKSEISEDEERLMARQAATKFIQHSIHSVSMYGNEVGRTSTGSLKVHEVVRQLGARFKEAQGTTKVVLAAKKEAEDIKGIQGTLQELATAVALLASK